MSNLATEANYEVIVDYRGHHASNVTKIAFTELAKKVGPTVCPKVPYISKVPLFSAKCGWILKPFGLLIAHTLRFDMVYEVA